MRRILFLLMIISWCLLSCKSINDPKIIYPDEFEIYGVKYVCDYDWGY